MKKEIKHSHIHSHSFLNFFYKAFVFSEVDNVNMTEAKLIKGLREGGYTRPQEIDHMIVKGAAVSTYISHLDLAN